MPAVVDVRERAPRPADLVEEALVVADDECEALVQAPRPPVLPREVAADDERKPPRRAVALERRGLAVVRGQDGAVAPVGRRQAAPGPRGLIGELRPAELVLVERVLPGPGADHRRGRANRQDERRRHGQNGELDHHERAYRRVAHRAPRTQPAAKSDDPRSEGDRVAGQRVVAPPALHEEEECHHDRHDRERTQARTPPEPDDPDHGDHRSGDAEEEQPLDHVVDARGVLCGLGVLARREVDARPSVLRLPDEVRQEDEERDAEGDPRPARREQPSRRGREQPDREGGQEHDDRVLRLEPDPGDEAEHRPQARLRPAEHPQRDVQERCPRELVEPGRVEDAGRAERDREQRPAERGSELRSPPAAELAHHQRDEDDHCDPCRQTGQAQRDERVAGDGAHEPGDPGRERREVDVAERRPPRRGEEVELVAVPAVAADERELDRSRERPAREPAQQRRPNGSQMLMSTRLTHRGLPGRGRRGRRRPTRPRTGTPCASLLPV